MLCKGWNRAPRIINDKSVMTHMRMRSKAMTQNGVRWMCGLTCVYDESVDAQHIDTREMTAEGISATLSHSCLEERPC